MNYRILHRTIYDYSEPVTVSHHAARLKPLAHQRADSAPIFSLEILPEPAVRTIRWTDYFGNPVCFFSVQQIHQRLEISATSLVGVNRVTAPALGLSPDWKHVAAIFRQNPPPRKQPNRNAQFRSSIRRCCAPRRNSPITPPKVFPATLPCWASRI